MRPILAGLGVILAGVIFFGYTKPTYDSIQTTQAQIAQYNQALTQAAQLEQLKQSLLAKYNAFNPADLARLQVFLPDQVNNIGLILDLDTLANQFGTALENVDISTPDASGSSSDASAGSATSVGVSPALYDSLQVSFTIHCTYSQFIQYISALETSLRIVDLVKLSVSGGGPAATASPISSQGSDNIVYTFAVTLQTYWLK